MLTDLLTDHFNSQRKALIFINFSTLSETFAGQRFHQRGVIISPTARHPLRLENKYVIGMGGFFPSTGYVRNCSLQGPPQGADGERLRVRSRKSPGGYVVLTRS